MSESCGWVCNRCGADIHKLGIPFHCMPDGNVYCEACWVEGKMYLDGVKGKVTDEVDHPAHYNLDGKMECIEALEASSTPEEFQGYLKNATMKYLWRYRYKGKPIQDLEKAAWYLNRLIEFLKKQENKKKLEGEHKP